MRRRTAGRADSPAAGSRPAARSRGLAVRLCFVLTLLVSLAIPALVTSPARAGIGISLGNRLETRWDESTSDTGVDDWFDARAFDSLWRAHVRLRIRQMTSGDADSADIDQRSLTLGTGPLAVTGGTFYETVGRGLVLRAYENRFVNLGRSDRSFSLDRDVDGARVRAEGEAWDLVALSGKPRLTVANGGTATPRTGQRLDLLQAVSGNVHALDRRVTVGASVVGAERRSLRSGGNVPAQTLRSARGSVMLDPATVYVEWADLRWHSDLPGLRSGRALYAEVAGFAGDFAGSVEYKNYDRYAFPYAEPPTLIRTHESVLLNASTHVLKPTEDGVQVEVVHSPDPEVTSTANLTGAWPEFFGRTFRYRELFVEHRVERDPVSWSAFADWAEDTFTGDDNRWTAGAGAEAHWNPEDAVFADLELQRVDPDGLEGFVNGFAQAGYSRAGLLTAAVRVQWTSREPAFDDEPTSWVAGTLNVELSGRHSLFVFGGTRPPGLVCSGGFCFFAPEFEGVEARLLSAF